VSAKSLSEEALDSLRAYSWPGNIRELRNAMDQVAVLARGDIVRADELELVRARLQSARRRSSVGFASSDAAKGELPNEIEVTAHEVAEPALAAWEGGSSWDAPTEETPPEETPPEEALETRRPADLPTAREETDHPLLVRVVIGTSLAEVERLLIMKTLGAASGNKQRAARILGISRRGLYTRLAAYGEKDAADHGPETADPDASP
jgi:DNA-binding NtrC family response regulator